MRRLRYSITPFEIYKIINELVGVDLRDRNKRSSKYLVDIKRLFVKLCYNYVAGVTSQELSYLLSIDRGLISYYQRTSYANKEDIIPIYLRVLRRMNTVVYQREGQDLKLVKEDLLEIEMHYDHMLFEAKRPYIQQLDRLKKSLSKYDHSLYDKLTKIKNREVLEEIEVQLSGYLRDKRRELKIFK